jgi:hypothetical protein
MPRIRTIKPEFWRHKQMSALPPFTRLVAIALLNVADDEGFFEADPMLIRGDVFPFENECGTITVALRELSGIGYVELLNHSEKGSIGFIPGFARHQVINKAGRSKLKPIWIAAGGRDPEKIAVETNSGSVPVVVSDESRPEQGTGKGNSEREKEGEPPTGLEGGTGKSEPGSGSGSGSGKEPGKRKPGKTSIGDIQIPESIDCPQFRDAWRQWIEYRTEGRKTITTATAAENMAVCARLGPDAAIAAIRRTISKGWPGLQPCPPNELYLYRPKSSDASRMF